MIRTHPVRHIACCGQRYGKQDTCLMSNQDKPAKGPVLSPKLRTGRSIRCNIDT